MEAESGRDLERFFDRWVLDSALPRVRITTATRAEALDVAYEQVGEVFDLPVTATLQYADGTSEDVVVPLIERPAPTWCRCAARCATSSSIATTRRSGTFERK